MIEELATLLSRRLGSLASLPGGFAPETGMLLDLVV
jgi:hypothetical protein